MNRATKIKMLRQWQQNQKGIHTVRFFKVDALTNTYYYMDDPEVRFNLETLNQEKNAKVIFRVHLT